MNVETGSSGLACRLRHRHSEHSGRGHGSIEVNRQAPHGFQAITGINIVMYYAPTIFTSAGIATSAALSHSVIIGLVMLVFTAVSMWLVDRAGRRPLMLLASAGMGISLALLGLMFVGNAGDGGWLLLWILTYVSSFSIGMGGIYWVVVSEIARLESQTAAVDLSVLIQLIHFKSPGSALAAANNTMTMSGRTAIGASSAYLRDSR